MSKEESKPKNPVGRPPVYTEPEEMQAVIDDYFETIKREGRVATVAGLAYHLGFASKQSLIDYETQMGGKFSFTVKRAKLIIENKYVETCASSKAPPVGNIFLLKANFGYRDNLDVNIGGQEDNKLNINVVTVSPLQPVSVKPED